VLSRRAGRGGGTTLPGRVLLALSPDAIERLAARLPLGSAVVSATNGKTTTCAMAAAILEPELPLRRNAAGANLLSGVGSALLERGDGVLGLFECDEAALPEVARRVRPHTLALGNLFRDQLDRYGELELVAERWRGLVAGLDADRLVVACADDPVTADLVDGRERALRYGLDDASVALDALEDASDSRWCVRCGHAYRYETVYLGHLGDYRCPHCGHGRPRLDVAARDVRQRGLDATAFRLVTPFGERPVELPLPGLYNVYNALAASALALSLGAPLDDVVAGLEGFRSAFGRFERLRVGDREAVLLLIKNPAGANEALRTLHGGGTGPLRLLAALNDRIADGRDVSWIWDVDWERAVPSLEGVVVSGTRAEDLALRLKYAGLDDDRLTLEPELDRAFDRALAEAGPGGTSYVLPTYTAMLELQGIVASRGLARPYWERP
jgi:UDP-N-acetylmuramyl tripeptide synthase